MERTAEAGSRDHPPGVSRWGKRELGGQREEAGGGKQGRGPHSSLWPVWCRDLPFFCSSPCPSWAVSLMASTSTSQLRSPVPDSPRQPPFPPPAKHLHPICAAAGTQATPLDLRNRVKDSCLSWWHHRRPRHQPSQTPSRPALPLPRPHLYMQSLTVSSLATCSAPSHPARSLHI